MMQRTVCTSSGFVQLSERVHISQRAWQTIQAREPIVALESTIITHGMPYPNNLE